jgi:hypothetical protein
MTTCLKETAKHYGLTEKELDFIINYDIKYKMGGEFQNIDWKSNKRRFGLRPVDNSIGLGICNESYPKEEE